MKSTLVKLFVLIGMLSLAVIVVGSVNTTSADVLAQGAPPTVVLPTRQATKPPTPTFTPTKPGVVPQLVATPVAPLKATATRTATHTAIKPKAGLGGGGMNYDSGFQVQNLSSTTANISISYYKQSDGSLLGTTSDTIPGNSSKTYYPISLPGGATTFNGSVVITSDQQVAAIVNLLGNAPSYGASTSGFSSSAASTTFNLPLIMCNNSGFNTFFNVQNTGTVDANITITYIPGSHGTAGLTETATIKPGAAKTFDQAVGSNTRNCSTLADTSGRFIGSAKISSSQPVVATVMQLNTTTFPIMLGYNGFASGSTTVALPLVMANNNGFYTGIQIMNIGESPTTVNVAYATNTVGTWNPTNETCNLNPGQSCTLIQNSGQWTNRYVGAATVTNSANQNLVAIVNQVAQTRDGQGPFGTAYEGFNPSAATSNISAPLIMANNSGYYTGIQVQNAGNSFCANVTMTYGPDTAISDGAFNPTPENFSLAVGASKTIIQNGTPPGNGSSNNWATAGRYIGSATISAPGCKIVAIVNQLSSGAGDRFFTYNAFNY